MKKKSDFKKPVYGFLPKEIEGFDSLAELALDMRWSWDHSADEVWQQLEPDLWNLTQNPWLVLQTVSGVQFNKVMSDPGFQNKVKAILKSKELANNIPTWFNLINKKL